MQQPFCLFIICLSSWYINFIMKRFLSICCTNFQNNSASQVVPTISFELKLFLYPGSSHLLINIKNHLWLDLLPSLPNFKSKLADNLSSVAKLKLFQILKNFKMARATHSRHGANCDCTSNTSMEPILAAAMSALTEL